MHRQKSQKSTRSDSLPSQWSVPENNFIPAPTNYLPKGCGTVRSIGKEVAADQCTDNVSIGMGWHLALPPVDPKSDKAFPSCRGSEKSDVLIRSGYDLNKEEANASRR
jgi:hypothetical protein